MIFSLETLVDFIVRAKKAAYAGDGAEVPLDQIQTPGFKDLSFKEGDWEYRDSYAGYFLAPGREVVWFQGRPVWMMAYSGGMSPDCRVDKTFAKQTFTFLKKALLLITADRPFRGPLSFSEGPYRYEDSSEGGVTRFRGREHIFYEGKEVFSQDYLGSLIIPKA